MLILLLAALLSLPAPAIAQVGAGEAPMLLEAGDLLQVRIWREPDLSGDFLIDETGTVTLPLLGPGLVAGRSVAEVRDSLIAAYSLELRNPSIVITPLRRVYVLGEVNQPGLKAVDPTVTLAGVVALAGGANPQGDIGNIRVIRNGVLLMEGISADRALADMDVRSGDQVFVGRRSWFDRNSTFVVSALLSITSIAITLVR